MQNDLYTRYPIVARRTVQPLGQVRRASKGILHTTKQCDAAEAQYLTVHLMFFILCHVEYKQ